MGTVTISAQTYDIYDTLANADKYLGGSAAYSALWAEATLITGAREKALVEAKRLLDRQKWKGTTTAAYPIPQPLQWPRNGATDADDNAVPNGTTPQQVIDASFELAAMLYDDPDGTRLDRASTNVKVAQAGSAKVELFARLLVGRFPLNIGELIAGYLTGGASSTTGVGEAFGADGESAFDAADSFEVA